MTTQTTKPLDFPFDSHNVRVIMRDGEPWFVAADVCAALDLPETHKAVARLDDDEKGRNSIPTLGGMQEMTVISESGLYNLTLGSRKPEAKRFKRWVTHDVLPTIRRTGGYGNRLNDASMRVLTAHKRAADLLHRLSTTKKRALQLSLYDHLVIQRQALGLGTPPIDELCDLEPPPPPQPPAVAAFWQVVGALQALGVPLNHSRNPALLAISFPELQALATTHALALPSKLECRAITLGTEPRYLGTRVVNSAITRLPKWTWVFRAGPAPQPAAATTPKLALGLDDGGDR